MHIKALFHLPIILSTQLDLTLVFAKLCVSEFGHAISTSKPVYKVTTVQPEEREDTSGWPGEDLTKSCY